MRTKTGIIKIILTSAALAALMILRGSSASASQETGITSADTETAGESTALQETGISMAERSDAPQQSIDKPVVSEADLPHALSFSAVIPPEFKPSDMPGVFVTSRYPLDAANITVSIVDIAEEAALTNSEKAAMSERGETRASLKRLYASLTKDAWTKAATEMMEDGLELSVESFDRITLRRASDGTAFPGYRIISKITGAKKDITEETRMFISDDKVFTVSCAWASDDEFEDIFAECFRSIAAY